MPLSLAQRSAPATLPDVLAILERRAAEAEREGATAPVANVYRVVLEELRPLVGAEGNGAARPTSGPERLLTVTQVAELLATSERWVYDHQKQLGGKRLSRRCLRFVESAVRRYLERRP